MEVLKMYSFWFTNVLQPGCLSTKVYLKKVCHIFFQYFLQYNLIMKELYARKNLYNICTSMNNFKFKNPVYVRSIKRGCKQIFSSSIDQATIQFLKQIR